MFRTIRKIAVVLAMVALWSTSYHASAVVIFTPSENASDDVFTYQFAGAGFEIAPSAAAANLDTDTLSVQAPGSPIGLLLGTSRSATADHMLDQNGAIVTSGGQIVSTGHDGFS